MTGDQTAALRAFLIRDPQTSESLTKQLGDGIEGYLYLAQAALCVAARRRFAPRFAGTDIVHYVAELRASRIADGDEYDIDPAAAESVLGYFLGQDIQLPEFEPRIRVVFALLESLTDDLASEADADQLLGEAREVADRWESHQAE